MRFFHVKFLNARGSLAQKNIMRALFFVNFLTLKMGTIPAAKRRRSYIHDRFFTKKFGELQETSKHLFSFEY